MKTAVLISGGVDSSVALRLLKDQGHDITAFYLKIWLQDEFTSLGDCPWEDDLKNVRAVCEQAEVPLEVIPLQSEYWDTVVEYTIREIKSGRTPNPDIFCNSMIKFGEFYNKIDESYEKVASGHYANVETNDDKYLLKTSPDPVKDQTYFLAYLKQHQLARALFPIGLYTKREVRELAYKYDLPNKDKKDSQGICFLGQIKFKDFVKFHLGVQKGDIINYDTGEKMSEHEGFYYYTIGQRQGIGLGGGPWYVVKKDPDNNIVYISRQNIDEKAKDEFSVEDINWFTGAPDFDEMKVKIRHGPKFYNCRVNIRDERSADVKLIGSSDKGIAPGQFAVFYKGEYCLGGGKISEDQ